jgi:hypothetical protein
MANYRVDSMVTLVKSKTKERKGKGKGIFGRVKEGVRRRMGKDWVA